MAARPHRVAVRLAAAFTATFTLAAAGLIVVLPAAPASAQDEINAPQVENSKLNFSGIVNANAVYVHSGAGQNYYPTVKLDKGTEVTVVGIKFEWLKIVPPEGSFSYVAKAFVERAGDGKIGRVTRPDLNVRAGSQLNDMKAIIQTKLEQGAEVEIVGEKDEYFMIRPPEGAYAYINKQFVDPVKPIDPVAEKPADAPAAPQTGEQPAAPVEGNGGEAVATDSPQQPPMTPDAAGDGGAMTTETPTEQAAAPDGATTQPVADGGASAAATQPTKLADAEFDRLEGEFDAASALGIEEQPVAELLAQYETLVKNPTLPESMRRIADFRINTLKLRDQVRTELLAVRKSQEEAAARRMALQAEREELAEQIKQTSVTMYTAVGTLQTSSLQIGIARGQTLYRLTDPANGRTIVYVRTDDPGTYAPFLGQFIGVKGELSTEPMLSMKVVTPTEAQEIDQNALYRTIAAQVIPPSLLPKFEASTGSNAPANE